MLDKAYDFMRSHRTKAYYYLSFITFIKFSQNISRNTGGGGNFHS